MTARGEPLEAFEIDRHIAQPAMREVADQILRGIGPERLAQLQQAVAQAVAGFLGALMQSQDVLI
jgi:hypothetical protein